MEKGFKSAKPTVKTHRKIKRGLVLAKRKSWENLSVRNTCKTEKLNAERIKTSTAVIFKCTSRDLSKKKL